MIATASQFRDWDVALMILVMIIALCAVDIPERLWRRRFYSPERKRIRDIAKGLR